MQTQYYSNQCPRVQQRMECPECAYPFSEAMVGLDESVPHVGPALRWLDTIVDVSDADVEMTHLQFVGEYYPGEGEYFNSSAVPVSERHPDGIQTIRSFQSTVIADIHPERTNAFIYLTQVDCQPIRPSDFSKYFIGNISTAKALIAALQEVVDLVEKNVGGG